MELAFDPSQSDASTFVGLEITMPNANLSGMTVEALMDLRKRVDEALHKRRAELEKQLERIAVVGGARIVRGGGSALRGRKVPPKYRGPSGKLGQAGVQNHVGSLLRSKAKRNSMS